MISFQGVRFTYPGASAPALAIDRLSIQEGEFCLVMGETGSGKSTLLRAINGLVPHFSGGTMAGEVAVFGRSTRHHRPRDLADLVGYVGQSASAGFVAETVEEELAYTMENLGVAPQAMNASATTAGTFTATASETSTTATIGWRRAYANNPASRKSII